MSRFEQAKQIVSGLTNYLKMKANVSNSEIEEIQRKRFAICIECEFRNKEKNTCNLCGCFLVVKTRSLEASCPEKYWTKIDLKR